MGETGDSVFWLRRSFLARAKKAVGEERASSIGRECIWGPVWRQGDAPTQDPSPLPLSHRTPPNRERGPGWCVLAVLPLLPVGGVRRGREKRAGVMRVFGRGALLRLD